MKTIFILLMLISYATAQELNKEMLKKVVDHLVSEEIVDENEAKRLKTEIKKVSQEKLDKSSKVLRKIAGAFEEEDYEKPLKVGPRTSSEINHQKKMIHSVEKIMFQER